MVKPGSYQFDSIHEGRPAYFSEETKQYLYFVSEHPARWIMDDTLGKKDGHGYIRHEGNAFCPDLVGQKWSAYWNKNVVNKNIKVECSGNFTFWIVLLVEKATLTFSPINSDF